MADTSVIYLVSRRFELQIVLYYGSVLSALAAKWTRKRRRFRDTIATILNAIPVRGSLTPFVSVRIES